MSQPAKKRPVPPSAAVTDEVRDQEGSGRFVIEPARSSSTMLPPTSPVAEGAQALEALPLLELEPDAVEELPARGIVSGVFANRGAEPSDARDDELENAVASMHAYYRDSERAQHERAQLVIEDFSLLPGNPYGASSLVPPTRKPFALGKLLGFAALAVGLGTGAWFVQRETSSARDHAAPVASAVVAAPVVSVPVAAQPVIAPAQPQVEPPAPAAPVAVVATAAAEREVQPAVVAVHKANVAVAAPEAARPAAPAPAAHQGDEHEATAQAALRAVLAESAPASAAPSETPVAIAAPPVAATDSTATATADAMGALPDLPSREDVVTGFESVRDELSKCAAGKHGTVKIDTTIANSGRVSRALIDGVFKGTTEGSCMARAARAARFPQFGRSSLNVSYPIAL